MGVYIKGMEMPKQGFVEILIRDDGTVQQTGQSNRIGGTDYYTPYVGEIPAIYKAATVPPHGRLIVEDDAIETAWMILAGIGYRREENPQLEQTVREVYATAPTIEVE